MLLAAQGLPLEGVQMLAEQIRDLYRRPIARPARRAGMRGHGKPASAEAASACSAEQIERAHDAGESLRAQVQIDARALQMRMTEECLDREGPSQRPVGAWRTSDEAYEV